MYKNLSNLLVPSEISTWSYKNEIIAALVNFLTAAYIIAVNPEILSQAGMSKSALVSATCYSAAIGCFLMAFLARAPILLAPGMGLNAFFAYTLCINEGVQWQIALGIVFLSGVTFVVLSVLGLRERILYSIPHGLRMAIPVGIGLFIAFIGFTNMGLITEHPVTLVSLAPISKTVIIALIGLGLVFLLNYYKVPGSLLFVIIGITIVSILLGWNNWPDTIISSPPSIEPTAFKLDIISAIKPIYWVPIFVFLYIDLFDSLGSLTAISYEAGLTKGEDVPRLGRMFLSDALATTFGSLLGTSSVTAYVESGAGVAVGGRTGWTALFTGLLFLIAPLFYGFISVIPSYATSIALIIVGIYMIKHIKNIEFTSWIEGPPAFLTIILMPLTFSIATGLCFGVLSYVFILVGTGRVKKINPILAVVFILSLMYLLIGTH